jgi:hypothetical protein
MPVASESLVIPIGGRQQIEADVYVRDRAIGPVIDERDPEGGYARGRCGAGDRAGREHLFEEPGTLERVERMVHSISTEI